MSSPVASKQKTRTLLHGTRVYLPYYLCVSMAGFDVLFMWIIFLAEDDVFMGNEMFVLTLSMLKLGSLDPVFSVRFICVYM